MKSLYLVLALSLTLLSGCLSDDKGDGEASNPSSVNGFWSGSFTEVGVGAFDMRGFLQDGKIAFNDSNGDFYNGNYTMNGNNFTGTVLNVYSGVTSTINGQINGKNISANFSYHGQHAGSLSLSYDEFYSKSTSLTDLTGSWSYTSGPVSRELTIFPNGAFEGSNSNGCILSGKFENIDSKNVFKYYLSITGCGTGQFNGFAFLGDTYHPNDMLVTMGVNSGDGVYGVFYK